MVAAAHLHETYVRATPAVVWATLTDHDDAVGFTGGWRVETGLRPGGKWRLVRRADDVDVVEGDVESVDAPTRLVVTWRFVGGDAAAGEPPSRVEWVLAPAGDAVAVTRVTVRHSDLALSPLTWARTRAIWPIVLASLKSAIETGDALPAIAVPVDGAEATDVEGNWHRAEAIAANNSVWELLDGRDLRPDEVDQLLERAYAAAHHWRRASGSTVVNRARAAYLVSRAHAFCGHGELALHHADRCSDLVSDAPDDMADFDHAYAYEARARALACLGRVSEAGEMQRRAAAVLIADEADRSIFESDLADGPWFALESGPS